MSDHQRNRIAEALMSRKDLERGFSLDDALTAQSPVYREDVPGPSAQERVPFNAAPNIDPYFAPNPQHMMGIEPTNDPMVQMDPADLANKYRYGSWT